MDGCLQVDQPLVEVNKDRLTTLVFINDSKSSCQLKSDVELAKACEVDDTNHTQETMSCTELAEVSSLN